jgi:hypothetical protein
MVDSEEASAVDLEADLVGLVLEEEARVVAGLAEEGAEVVAGVVGTVAAEVGVEIRMDAAVLITDSSRASVIGDVNSLRIRVPSLSRYKTLH